MSACLPRVSRSVHGLAETSPCSHPQASLLLIRLFGVLSLLFAARRSRGGRSSARGGRFRLLLDQGQGLEGDHGIERRVCGRRGTQSTERGRQIPMVKWHLLSKRKMLSDKTQTFQHRKSLVLSTPFLFPTLASTVFSSLQPTNTKEWQAAQQGPSRRGARFQPE